MMMNRRSICGDTENEGSMQRDGNLIRASLGNNGYKPMSPWINSTGFRTQPFRHREHQSLPRAAEDFLVNTRLLRDDVENEKSIESYLLDSGLVTLQLMGRDAPVGVRQVSLPPGAPVDIKFSDVLTLRRSKRDYTGDSIKLDHLSTLLHAGGGVSARAEVQLISGGTADLSLRTVPSGGGLYPVDILVVALNVLGLKLGIYSYHSTVDCLIEAGDEEDARNLIGTFAVSDEMISIPRANMLLLLVARPWKSMRKYGDRGLRFVFHEAGAIAQNIHLAATGLGLGSVDCASFYDDEAHASLGIDGVYQALVHAIVVGVPGE